MTDAVCTTGTPFAEQVHAVREGRATTDEAADAVVALLTDEELLWLLDGDLPMRQGLSELSRRYNAVPIEAGRVDRLGIPGIRFTDGPRGVVMGSSTSFPVAVARGATFDPDLERAVGNAIGAEARAQGANLFAGICVNLPPAPGWGRSQESYGEDPHLLGAMGVALTQGVQPWVMACVKHYALNSMEEARFLVDVRVAPDVLHEVYLPHFRAVVEAGADSVMSAYNSVNGEWAGDSPVLLTEILREQWSFRGFVMSDFVWGLRDPIGSVAAGQEIEMPVRMQRGRALPRALADGRLARADVERAARRLVRSQIELALRARPTPPLAVVASDEHRALAREVARRGSVLLRNEPVDGAPVLPLAAESLGSVAVVGRLADEANLGDVASSRVRPPSTASVLQGLRERLGDRVRTTAAPDAASAVALASGADVAVVVVGLTPAEEGEAVVALDGGALQVFGGPLALRPVAAVAARAVGLVMKMRRIVPGGDRRDLHLPADDVALVRAVAAANPRTVVVVIGGGTVMLDPWDDEVASVLLAWYPGMEGGRAVADLLLGDADPGGRLPVAVPRRRQDLPVVDWLARRVTYGRWWGQRQLDRTGNRAAYPFGFGLSYTTFRLDDLAVGPVDGEHFSATTTVTNTGDRDGRHVVQVYGRGLERVPVLVGFRAVELPAGGTVQVTVACSTRPLQRWDGTRLTNPSGDVEVTASSFSGDPAALRGTLRLGDS